MQNHPDRSSTRIPAMRVLAAAVTSILLTAALPSQAQAAYQDPGQTGNTSSWKTAEFSKDWGLAAIGAEYAYARGLSGASVNAGIMDDGVATWHTELQGKVSGILSHSKGCDSPNFIAGAKACYYSNGGPSVTYTEPMTQAQLAALKQDVRDGKLSQANLDYILSLEGYKYGTHGTHVAGTIAAHRNGDGTHGVAYGASLHSTTFISNTYQDMNYVMGKAEGLSFTQQPPKEVLKSTYAQMAARGVRVLNNSWGWSEEPKTAAEMDAVAEYDPSLTSTYSDWAKKNDAVQVWAAGNNYGQIAGFLATIPRYDKDAEAHWLSVVNLGRNGDLDSSSSICGLSQAWCITAPGTDIPSSIPEGKLEGKILEYDDQSVAGFEITKAEQRSGYETHTGTSMAAPHVTGAMALLLERYPYLSSVQVRDVLLTTAKDLGAAGVDEVYGWGLVDLKKAIDGPGQMRVDSEVKMDRRAGGAKVWQGAAWEDWRNDIGGPGKLSKAGAGWLRLSGNNRFGGAVLKEGVLELVGNNALTGDMQVLGGELLLNGQLRDTPLNVVGGVATVNGEVSAGATEVAAHARLQGTGTLAQTSVAGVIAPGVAGIGTLHVLGAYTQLPGSTYEVDLAAQGKADLLDVRGPAELQGGTVKAFGAILGEHYRIVSAQSIAGAFAGASSDNQPFLSFKLAQTSTQINLDVERGKALVTAAFTPNQQAAAGAADAMGDQSALLKRLTQLSAAQATAAFDRISAETHASQRTVLLEQGQGMNELAASRLRSVRDVAANEGDATAGQGVWFDASNWNGHFNGDGNAAGTHYQNNGMTVGYDWQFANGWTAGALGLRGQGETEVAHRFSKDEYRSRGMGVYASKDWQNVALRGGWMMSEHHIDASRQVAYGTHNELNRAHYTSDSQQGFVEAGYGLKLDEHVALEPYAQWSRVEVKSPHFQEQGGLSALNVEAGRSQADFATAGLRLVAKPVQGSSQDWLQFHGTLAYRHASGDWKAMTMAAWQDGNAFTSWGAPLSRQATLLNLKLGARLSQNSLLDLGYDGQFGSEGEEHAVNARLSLTF